METIPVQTFDLGKLDLPTITQAYILGRSKGLEIRKHDLLHFGSVYNLTNKKSAYKRIFSEAIFRQHLG